MAGVVTGGPLVLLRFEGVFVLAAASAAYREQGYSWWLYAALFFVPDVFMLGYFAGRQAGAIVYNAGHWYALPLACVAWGAFAQAPSALAVGLIWAAHIGFDRAIGAGLKYREGFNISHLGSLAARSSSVPRRITEPRSQAPAADRG